MKNEKYNLFRNYMMNELGISKEDIRLWTLETIEKIVETKISEIDLEKVVADKFLKSLNANKGSGPVGYYLNIKDQLYKDVAKAIADRVVFNLEVQDEKASG